MPTKRPTGKQPETRRRRERLGLIHETKPCGVHEDVHVGRSQPRKQASVPEPPFTVAGFAEFMDVVPKTVHKWIDRKKLKAFRKGRIIRIPPEAAKEFIRKHIK